MAIVTKTWSNNQCNIRGFGITLCHVKSNKAEDARQLAKGSLDLATLVASEAKTHVVGWVVDGGYRWTAI